MDLILVLTALGAVVSCSFRAIGPRPTRWTQAPEMGVDEFTKSFGGDLE